MKPIQSILAIVTLIATAGTADAISIIGGPVYNPATTHTYYLLSPATWDNAELFSHTLGGHLITINNAAENDWMYGAFIAGHPTLNPWTGLNDIGTPGVWHWSSGEAVTYMNFAPGEPNQIGAPPYGVNIFPASPYPTFEKKCNDAPLYDVVPALVEVPEPSTLSLGLIAIGLAVARSRRR
jgi:hypothetical protein